MTTIVLSQTVREAKAIYITLLCGNKKYELSYRNGFLNVLNANASSKAWRAGTGKNFHGQNVIAQAKAAYKSAEAKEALGYLESEIKLLTAKGEFAG